MISIIYIIYINIYNIYTDIQADGLHCNCHVEVVTDAIPVRISMILLFDPELWVS